MTAVHPSTVETVLPDGTARPDYPNDPLPAWVTGLRPLQVTAVREVIEAFDDGADVVFLDAPVGAGKTLIGELVRRELGVTRGLYVCTDKSLQDQVLRDFPYARVLKGRANYVPDLAVGEVTCEDCTLGSGGGAGAGGGCNWCSDPNTCPYRVAKHRALGQKIDKKWEGGAALAVLNTSYMLTAANYARTMRRYDLVVVDECDMMEGALIGFIEYSVPGWIGKLVHLQAPKKSVRKPTLIKWLGETADLVSEWVADNPGRLEVKKMNKLRGFIDETRTTAKYLQLDVDAASRHADDDSDGDQAGRWIRDYGDSYHPVQYLKLRPVTVSQHGPKHLWRHGTKFLFMSGTVISSDELGDSLGLPVDYATVTIPSSFPVENRPIILAPVANVTARAEDRDYEALIYAIEQIAAKHEGRILVHTVSYALTKRLFDGVRTPTHRKVTYTAAREKNHALREYLTHTNAILFAPSMDRGVDLAGDKCAVQVIAKCPFPSLGDKQVSSRLHLPGGQQWYSVKTVRDIVQMTGRGVRSETDTCVTYILDQQFTRNVWGKNQTLFPAYFREAVQHRADIRFLLKPRT